MRITRALNTVTLPVPLTPTTHLRRVQAWRYLNEHHNYYIGETTLASLASRGNGPRFHMSGRVVTYQVADLDVWVAERRAVSFSSTAERRAARAERAA